MRARMPGIAERRALYTKVATQLMAVLLIIYR